MSETYTLLLYLREPTVATAAAPAPSHPINNNHSIIIQCRPVGKGPASRPILRALSQNISYSKCYGRKLVHKRKCMELKLFLPGSPEGSKKKKKNSKCFPVNTGNNASTGSTNSTDGRNTANTERSSTSLKIRAVSTISSVEPPEIQRVPFSFFFFYPPADGEKKSFSSPHFHVFSYASCVDLTRLLSQPNASWRTLRVPL